MRRIPLLELLLGFAVSAVGLAEAPSVGPGEPEILLPKVILEIPDLSVEKLDARLPPEEELLPPRREIPLPTEADLPVGEASLPMPAPGEPGVSAPAAQRGITSEAVLGAGMQASILGSLSLKTLGSGPRLGFSFSHESMDGFFDNPPHPAGSGFSSRSDDISGEIAGSIGPVGADAKGSFAEDERGLQSRSPSYITLLSRTLDGSADFTFSPLPWLTLDGSVNGGAVSLILTGAAPLPGSEMRVAPKLGATARLDGARLGLEAEYSYRHAEISAAMQDLQRVRAGLSFAVDLPARLLLEGSAAFFWSTSAASLLPFPFAIGFSGTPVDFLTFRLGFGYRVVPYDAEDVVSSAPFLLPSGLADDRGWFGEARLQMSPGKTLSLTASLSFMASEAMPDAAIVNGALQTDPATGLFVFRQTPANRLTSELGARWAAAPGFSLDGSWKHEFRGFLFLDSPAYLPVDDIGLEGVGIAADGGFGGNLSLAVRMGVSRPAQLPEVNIGGFLRFSDSVRFQVDIEDLLQPAILGARYQAFPYIDPGFRVTGKLRMTF